MKDLIAAAAALAGGELTAAEDMEGGYTTQQVIRLRFERAPSLVLKGAPPPAPGDLIDWRAVLRDEARRYRTLTMLRDGQPSVISELEAGGWYGLLLEDLGGARALPPWDEEALEAVAAGLAAMHGATVSGPRPALAEEMRWPDDWVRVRDAGRRRGKLPEAWDRPQFWNWLLRFSALQRQASTELAGTVRCVAHEDVRSDNIFLRDGRLILIDWSDASWDSPLVDSVYWAITADNEGGGMAEELHRKYARNAPWAAPAAVAGVLGTFAGYFVHRLQTAAATPRHWTAWTRLLRRTLRWAATEFEPDPPPLPEPEGR